ncbi:MAG: hypothetical protein NC082_08645, partial [Clostridiales bacterium]|nr:hypothetical protein [Clostridiales bacterium]
EQTYLKELYENGKTSDKKNRFQLSIVKRYKDRINYLLKATSKEELYPSSPCIYPQWQVGNIARWIPDIPAEDASRGYYLGSMLFNYLAPETSDETFTVPVSTDI